MPAVARLMTAACHTTPVHVSHRPFDVPHRRPRVQVASIVEQMGSPRQTLLFTATWPKEVRALASTYLRADAKRVFIGGADGKLVANKARLDHESNTRVDPLCPDGDAC